MSLDLVSLRLAALTKFKAYATRQFAANPKAQSLVLAVAQYWDDEAHDAVHNIVVAFPTVEPWWPHHCSDDASDGAECLSCTTYSPARHDTNGLAVDANHDAVFAWVAFCSETAANQNGDSDQFDPIAIARRAEDGGVELEEVFELVRPWLDRNDVGEQREDRAWWHASNAAAPEPRRPWSSSERKLLAAVLANPNDDAPRRVLVDAWLEQGDVRGEFGALSFSPQSGLLEARRAELAAVHGRGWLGPLQPFISVAGATFDRGPFVSRAVVHFRDVAALNQARDVEEWALLERLRFVGRQAFNQHLRGLREATGVSVEGLQSLAQVRLPPTLEVLGVTEHLDDALWCYSLSKMHTLILEERFQVGPAVTEFAAFSKLRSLEVWFRLEVGGFDRWLDSRAAEALAMLATRVPVGLRVSVGYHLPNGARAGVVATLMGGTSEVRLEHRRFASMLERERAQTHLELAGVPVS